MTNESKQSPWDRFQAVAAPVATVLAALLVASVGGYYTATTKESENRIKSVEIAVAVLRSEPRPENVALRGWAVEVMTQQSTVPLSSQAQAELRNYGLSAATNRCDGKALGANCIQNSGDSGTCVQTSSGQPRCQPRSTP